MEASSSLALAVRHATRRIGERDVLSSASLRVPRGTAVGLLGPNGAGKTSLLRAIAGRLRLDAGDVCIAGLPAAEARRAGQLGIVPQDIALFAHLTVQENLSVLGRLAGLSAPLLRARLADGLEWAGLAGRADARVSTLSGGMRRRVNLVAGTLHHPALLLLDEPTVGVDTDARARLHDLLRALRRQGMGLLIATHDADEASAICDEVAIMDGGRVVVQSPIVQLIAEAFAGLREVSLVVEQPLPPSVEAVLRQERFHPAGEGRFVSRVGGADANLDALHQRLRDAGVRVCETRVAEPHLGGAVALLLERHRKRPAA